MKPSEYIEKGWTQGEIARNESGYCVPASDPDAVCWCAVGAIGAAYPIDKTMHPDYLEARDSIRRVLSESGVECSISEWNDDPRRTKEEVLDLFRKAGL